MHKLNMTRSVTFKQRRGRGKEPKIVHATVPWSVHGALYVLEKLALSLRLGSGAGEQTGPRLRAGTGLPQHTGVPVTPAVCRICLTGLFLGLGATGVSTGQGNPGSQSPQQKVPEKKEGQERRAEEGQSCARSRGRAGSWEHKVGSGHFRGHQPGRQPPDLGA